MLSPPDKLSRWSDNHVIGKVFFRSVLIAMNGWRYQKEGVSTINTDDPYKGLEWGLFRRTKRFFVEKPTSERESVRPAAGRQLVAVSCSIGGEPLPVPNVLPVMFINIFVKSVVAINK